MEKKTVLITGSSRGLGRSLALTFARNQYNVVLHGRNRKLLEEVYEGVGEWNVGCEIVFGHLSESRTIEKLAEVASKKKLNVFINNAGVYFKKDIMEARDVEIREAIETNLIAPILLTKRMLGVFQQLGGGAIININSMAGKVPNAEEPVYCASKYGLRGFTQSLSFHRGKVRMLDVYLGAMKTNMTSGREDYNQLIDPTEAADIIFNLAEECGSLKIKEVDIGRKIY